MTAGEPQVEDRQPRRWPSRRLRVLLYIVATIAAADLVAIGVTGLMLRREVGRLRVRGYLPPATRIVPQVPSGQANAADVYLLAFSARQSLGSEEADLVTGRPDQWQPGALANSRWILNRSAEHFRILEQASRIPGCAFPVDWNAAPTMALPHLGEFRRSARLLRARAAVAAVDGRLDAALGDCITMLRMAAHLASEPTLMDQASSYAIQDMAVRSMENVLSTGAPSPKAARELLRQLAAIDIRESSIRAAKAETELFGMKIFDMARQVDGSKFRALVGNDDDAGHLWQYRILRAYGTVARPLANLDEVAYLQATRRDVDAFSLAWPESHRTLKALRKQQEALPLYRTILTRMIMPGFDRVVESREKTAAGLGDAQIALALTIYKSEHGVYPDSLATLEAAGFMLPMDPFGGKPYRYRREDDGFIVYSIGADLQDQAGRQADTHSPGRPGTVGRTIVLPGATVPLYLRPRPRHEAAPASGDDITFRVAR